MPRGRTQVLWLRQVESYLKHSGPGVCLGDGQTEAEGVSLQGGRDEGA